MASVGTSAARMAPVRPVMRPAATACAASAKTGAMASAGSSTRAMCAPQNRASALQRSAGSRRFEGAAKSSTSQTHVTATPGASAAGHAIRREKGRRARPAAASAATATTRLRPTARSRVGGNLYSGGAGQMATRTSRSATPKAGTSHDDRRSRRKGQVNVQRRPCAAAGSGAPEADGWGSDARSRAAALSRSAVKAAMSDAGMGSPGGIRRCSVRGFT